MTRNLLRLLPLLTALLLAGCTDDGVAECSESNTVCGSDCTNLQNDPNNCGSCGNVCASDYQCIAGECACLPGQTACGDTCSDLQNDARNCGGCGIACASGEFCSEGACVTNTACTGIECTVEGEVACIPNPESNAEHCGSCGNACPEGVSCLGGSCAVGNLYGACFSEGTVVPLIKESHTPVSPRATGIDGPQSLALLGDSHLVALGANDQTLWIYDRATMEPVGSELVGSVPNQVLVREERAYVIISGENSVQVVDLSDPTAPDTVDQVALGEGTNPMSGAFDGQGRLWVSTWLSNEAIPVDFDGAAGEAGDPVALDTTGLEGTAYPAGVAVVGETVYVALNNLAEDFTPAGNGRLATLSTEGTATGLIDLGESCKNPGFLAADGTDLYVSCTASYFDGEVITLDTVSGEVTRRVETGGGPSRISIDTSRPGHLYVADGASLGFFSIDPEGEFTRVDVCPAPGEGGWEFNSDVLVAP